MDPLELLLECWFEVDVLAFLWTPGMIWLKKCPLWVDYSNTDPFPWTGCSRLLSCGLQMEPQVAPALAPSQRRSEILWLWMRARNLCCKLCFSGSADDFRLSGRVASLFTGVVGEKGGRGWRRRAAAGCVRSWWEDDSEDRSASLWGGSVSWLLCVAMHPLWNVTSSNIFSEEDNECFGGFNLTPHRFYKFFRFFDSCLTFWAPKCRQ